MPRPPLKSPRPEVSGRYPLAVVREEVRRVFDDEIAAGDPKSGARKRAALTIGMSETTFSKHFNAETLDSYFSFEELGRLAEFVSRELHRLAPPGWPFVTYATWEHQIDRAVKERLRSR